MGRGGSTPSIRKAIAFASKTPIQIGRKSWLWVSRRMTIGTFDAGSSISPLISTRSSWVGSLMPYCAGRPGGRSSESSERCPLTEQAVGQGRGDPHAGHIAERHGLGAHREMDDPVARRAPRLGARLLPPAGDHDVEALPHQALVDLPLDLVLEGKEALQALGGDLRVDRAVEARRRGSGPRGIHEGEEG